MLTNRIFSIFGPLSKIKCVPMTVSAPHGWWVELTLTVLLPGLGKEDVKVLAAMTPPQGRQGVRPQQQHHEGWQRGSGGP
jgi:hypothetical protein